MRMTIVKNNRLHRFPDRLMMIILPDTNDRHLFVFVEECCIHRFGWSLISQCDGGTFVNKASVHTACFVVFEISSRGQRHAESLFVSLINPHDPEGLLLFIGSAHSMDPFVVKPDLLPRYVHRSGSGFESSFLKDFCTEGMIPFVSY